jgi:hypothetical protein
MKKTLAMAAMAAPAALAASEETPFEAAHIAHSGGFHVEATPEHAFQLFTAPGERLWAPGWDPVILSGGDGRPEGSVWITSHGEERTVWVVVDYDTDALHARYARVTPASRAGTVEVFVRPDGSGESAVEVRYVRTALNETGNEDLAEFDADYFAHMMEEWERLIREADIGYPVQIEGS